MKFLAIIAYQCHINDKANDSFDIQIKYFEDDNEEVVKNRIKNEEVTHYLNDENERVEWKLYEIINIELLLELKDGEELIGFTSELKSEFNTIDLTNGSN